MDWQRAGVVAQGQAILAGLICPVELAETCLAAAAAHPDCDRIYARLTPERAREEAIAAHDRARAGTRRGPLDGVALCWKDNIDSAGIATEAGSRLLEGRLPLTDAEALAGASASGLVCLGKTHMTELAFSGIGVNTVTATPPNALDPALAPGGSSSGTAVAVALGLAPAGIGTDTGGSVRLPAAWNGLVGFMPSPGMVSNTGVVPLCPSFDVVGPITRNVADAAALMAVLTGSKTVDLEGAGAAGLRLMVLDGVPFADARAGPVTAFDEAVARLSGAGARITRAAPPIVEEAMGLAGILFPAEAYGVWAAHIEADPDLMHPPTLKRFRMGREITAPTYVAAWQRLHRLRRDWAAQVAGHDAVLLPTSPILPPETARLLADDAFFMTENLLSLRNTRIANLLGLPAVSVPTGRPACGIMTMGTCGGDRALLRVAAGIEAALA